MGLIIPSEICQKEYENSREITKETTNKVMRNEIQFQENRVSTTKLKSNIKNQKKKLNDAKLLEVTNNTSFKTKLRSIEASTENGASICLTVIPTKQFVFLEKQSIWNAIRMRYNIPLERSPTLCVCGDSFNLQHALSCPQGGLVITRHNEMRNLTSEILGKGCKNVVIEPLLTLLTGKEFPKSSNTINQTSTDVSARGLWINGQTAFCDVRVFNPLARCHLHHSLSAVHKKNENEKERKYNQRILQVEHGSFTPIVFQCFGGMSWECSRFFLHTAERLANRGKQPKSKISAWIKARLNFALIRSMLLCLRETRIPSNFDNISEIDLCASVAEGNIE